MRKYTKPKIKQLYTYLHIIQFNRLQILSKKLSHARALKRKQVGEELTFTSTSKKREQTGRREYFHGSIEILYWQQLHYQCL